MAFIYDFKDFAYNAYKESVTYQLGNKLDMWKKKHIEKKDFDLPERVAVEAGNVLLILVSKVELLARAIILAGAFALYLTLSPLPVDQAVFKDRFLIPAYDAFAHTALNIFASCLALVFNISDPQSYFTRELSEKSV